MRASTKRLLTTEVAVYKGDELLVEGPLVDCAKALNVLPDTLWFYLTPTYQRRISKRKSLDKSRFVVRLDEDDEA